ncbi:MAG: hypothetical protein JNL42_09270 [Anaerolineae bacterium]|nr:hypothetical protein [Anaerolineae bacterium]
MSLHKPLRLALMVFASVALITGVVFGQDDGETALPDTGTPGLTDALDNLNLPPVPPAPPPLAATATPAPDNFLAQLDVNNAPVCTCAPLLFPANILRSGSAAPNAVNTQMANAVPRLARFGLAALRISAPNSDTAVMIGMRDGSFAFSKFQTVAFLTKGHELVRQSEETFEHDGFIITLTEDYQIEVIADDETVWFSGQVGIVGEDRVVIQGADDLGYYYAIADGYYMADTPEGDVLIDNGTTTYIYDFDETGALVELSDSDGNPYTVEFDQSGAIYITDVDGITSSFAEDGSFEMVDADGNVLEESSLYSDDEAVVNDDAAGQDAGDQGGAGGSDSGSGETNQPDDAGSEGDGGSGEDGG